MASPWKIDPTDPADRDGANEGGAVGGGDSAGDSTLPPPSSPQKILTEQIPSNHRDLQHHIRHIIPVKRLN